MQSLHTQHTGSSSSDVLALLASRNLANLENPEWQGYTPRATYDYTLFRVKRNDGRVTTVSLNSCLAQWAIQAMGGRKPVGQFVRAVVLEYRDEMLESCSGYASARLFQHLASGGSHASKFEEDVALRNEAIRLSKQVAARLAKKAAEEAEEAATAEIDAKLQAEAAASAKPVSPFLSTAGGYLYRVTDRGTGKRYIGLTRVGVEARWSGHLASAHKRGSQAPLHRAMRERPDDFSVESIAYYRKAKDLRSAEMAHILDEGTRWPGGYNASAGGEGLRRRGLTILDEYAVRHRLSEEQTRYLQENERWLPALGITRGALMRRLKSNMPYAEVISRPKQESVMKKPVCVDGIEYPSIAAALKARGISTSRFNKTRAKEGLSITQALLRCGSVYNEARGVRKGITAGEFAGLRR